MTESKPRPQQGLDKGDQSLAKALGEYYGICITHGVASTTATEFRLRNASAQFDRGARQMERLVREVCPDGLGR